jgi:mRNA-degrading endonuclease RelE of RelBE toxin-antitoxin system
MSQATPFRVLASPHFERDVRKRVKQNRQLLSLIREMRNVLAQDPYNRTNAHDITKLKDVKQGDGQYRIRSGDYRIRYDIFDSDVLLYSFTHRKDTY